MSRTVTIALVGALAALAAGCETTTTGNAAPTHSPGATSPSPTQPSPHGGQVGEKFTVTSGDTKYDVTLLSVDQQAQPADSFSSAEPGHHLAAAQFRVTAITRTDENANNSATVTGSDEQAYTSTLTQVAAGTNFADGQILLQPGSSLIGWVPFELPDGVQVARVQWAPSSGLSASNVEWLVSPAATAPGSTPTSATTPVPEATPTPTATTSPGAATPGQATDPAGIVIAYFDAINLHDYQRAWDLGGKNTTSSYSSFVSGFKTTANVDVQILDVSGDIGTAVVTARVNAQQTDGSTKVFEGTYTIKDGVIVEFNVRQVS